MTGTFRITARVFRLLALVGILFMFGAGTALAETASLTDDVTGSTTEAVSEKTEVVAPSGDRSEDDAAPLETVSESTSAEDAGSKVTDVTEQQKPNAPAEEPVETDVKTTATQPTASDDPAEATAPVTDKATEAVEETSGEITDVVEEPTKDVSEVVEKPAKTAETVADQPTEAAGETTAKGGEVTEVAAESTKAVEETAAEVGEVTEVAAESTDAIEGTTAEVGEVTEVAAESTDVIEETTPKAEDITQAVAESTKAAGTVVDQAGGAVQAITEKVTEVIEVATDSAKAVDEGPVSAIKPVTDALSEAGDISQAIAPVTEAVDQPLETVEPLIGHGAAPVDEVVGETTNLVDTLVEAVGETTKAVEPLVGDVAAPVVEVVGKTTETFEPLVGDVTAPAVGIIDDTTQVAASVAEVTEPVAVIVEETVETPMTDQLLAAVEPVVGPIREPVVGTTDQGTERVAPPTVQPTETDPVPGDAATSSPSEAGTDIGELIEALEEGILPISPPLEPINAQTAPAPSTPDAASTTPAALASSTASSLLSMIPPTLAETLPPTPVAGTPIGHSLIAPSTLASSSSGAGYALGLFAVLSMLGLIAPRLSRWLRSRPVLWRPDALAFGIELPG